MTKPSSTAMQAARDCVDEIIQRDEQNALRGLEEK